MSGNIGNGAPNSINSGNFNADKSAFLNEALQQANTANIVQKSEKDSLSTSSQKISTNSAEIVSRPQSFSGNNASLPKLESVRTFSASESEKIHDSLTDLISNSKEVEASVILTFMSIILESGILAEQEQKEVAQSAYNLQDMIKPTSDLIKAEGEKTAEITREQGDEMITEGAMGIAASSIEFATAVGGFMNASGEAEGPGSQETVVKETEEPESSVGSEEEESVEETSSSINRSEEEEEETSVKTGYSGSSAESEVDAPEDGSGDDFQRVQAEDESQNTESTLENDLEQQTEGTSPSEISKDETKESDRLQKEDDEHQVNEARTALNKKSSFRNRLSKGWTVGKTVMRYLGGRDGTMGYAISRSVNGVAKLINASINYDIANKQAEAATLKADSQELRMSSELLQSGESRVQSAAKSLEDVRDSAVNSLKEYNQGLSQASRTAFGG